MQTTLTSAADWVIVVPVILPLAAAALLLMLPRQIAPSWWIAMLTTMAVGISGAVMLWRVSTDGPLAMTMGRWLPPFGISFTADITGAALLLTAAVVTLVVLVYARAEEAGSGSSNRFHALVLLLLAGVSGAFLTGDLFNLYVWFEVMLAASFGLLILSGSAPAFDGAVKYGLLNLLGTSLFLAALGLLYGTLGTLNMADIAGRAAGADPAIMTSIGALLVVAFGTKAAAFPLNAWLPASYHTPPATVSALLGGLLTKVGVYALLRTLVLLLPASRDLLHPVIAAIAIATLLLAPLGALVENNLRRLVGYLLIGGVGAALAGLALPDDNGIGGAVAYVIQAMLTITGLYLVAGLIERSTGETDIRRMTVSGGSGTRLSVLLFVLLAAVAGVPPFLGFWPKLLLLLGAAERAAPAAQQAGDVFAWLVAAALLLNALLTLIAGFRAWATIFWQSAAEKAQSPASPPAGIPARQHVLGLGAAGGLVGLVVVMGLWPEPLLATGRAAAAGLLGPHAYVQAVGLAETVR